MKIRVLPETNSSSSHSLVYASLHSATIPSKYIEEYTYNFLKLIEDELAEKYRTLVRERLGKDIDEEVIKEFAETDTETIPHISISPSLSSYDSYDILAEMYFQVTKIVRKQGYYVDPAYDDDSELPPVPGLSAVFNSSDVRLYGMGNYVVATLIPEMKGGMFARLKFKYPPDNKADYTPIIPESIDLKITNKCYGNCPFCHEDSQPDGDHASTQSITKFIRMLHKEQVPEIAVGGGNPLLHPEIDKILHSIGEVSTVSITARDIDYIEYGIPDEAVGLGISLTTPQNLAYVLTMIGNYHLQYPVLHVINGVHSTEIVHKALTVMEIYNSRNAFFTTATPPAVLILGFKQFGRGARWKIRNTIDIDALMKKHPNTIFSFDDLAIEQLNMRKKLPQYAWDLMYNGKEGSYTMYIDLVREEYATNSYSATRKKITNWSLKKMFQDVRIV